MYFLTILQWMESLGINEGSIAYLLELEGEMSFLETVEDA